ncbi:type III secretion protein [Pectobacterium peruviense]|uniref:type III secretion protein n=1 Tax=Pectobacterium peruviense TaxID=2066479 RepID=UPI000DE33D39|nr:type III secretion protein [Pectobacterium peruviense]
MTAQAQSRGREPDGITPLAWVTWWVEDCLLQADPSWWTDGVMLPDSPQRRDWLHVNAVQLNHYFSLPLVLPPDPLASLIQMGALDTAQRETVLRLMARVCQPLREPNHADAEAIWCERLAKALRPGLWIPTSAAFSVQSTSVSSTSRYQDALMLLRVRYGETCWPRLRLLFPRDWGTHCQAPAMSLPASRLNALCDALIWKASASV